MFWLILVRALIYNTAVRSSTTATTTTTTTTKTTRTTGSITVPLDKELRTLSEKAF